MQNKNVAKIHIYLQLAKRLFDQFVPLFIKATYLPPHVKAKLPTR